MALANPYQSPVAGAELSSPEVAPDPWKAIAWRWERLRLVYNLVVGLVGILVAVNLPRAHQRMDGILAYGLAANVAYLFGPIGEMYLHWALDLTAHIVPPGLDRAMRDWAITTLLFGAGTLFSVLLTLAIGFALAL